MKLDVGKQVLIGGAGFVGSHLVEQMVEGGASEIVVFDNFTRGTRQNIAAATMSGRVKVVEGDILDAKAVEKVVDGADDENTRRRTFCVWQAFITLNMPTTFVCRPAGGSSTHWRSQLAARW
jgi:nucleoside-diphosphate-sugar epimerase